jgi:hypothetical protein
MKPLSVASLRQMASRLQLELEDDELERLRPMVRDLLDVTQRLRAAYGPRIDRPPQRSG